MAKTFLDLGRFTLNPAIVDDSYGKVRCVSSEINEPTSALKLFCAPVLGFTNNQFEDREKTLALNAFLRNCQ